MRRNDHSSRGFKRRKTNTREKEISFLIITEDTRSSKLYLEGVIREVQEAYKGSIVTNIPRDSKEDLEEAGIGPVDNVVEVSEEKQQTSTELPMPSKVKDSEEAQGISNCEEDEDSKEPVDISRDSMVRGCGMGTSRLLEEAKKIKAETLTPLIKLSKRQKTLGFMLLGQTKASNSGTSSTSQIKIYPPHERSIKKLLRKK